MIKAGQEITIKPEFQDAGDADVKWIAVDDEAKGRVTIQAQLGWPINPTQVVRVEMIEVAK